MKKILVIDDDYALREDLLEALVLESYEAFGASNGRDGIILALKHQPDLIICDINMPLLDGFGVIAELRGNLQTADIPFIFLSARKEEEFVERGLRLGASAYYTKPYRFSELLQTIKIHVEV